MKNIKEPDRNAPRFRGRRLSVLTADTLKALKKKYPEYKDMSFLQFKDIIMTFNGNIAQGVINNRSGVELPEGLGVVFMGSCPPPKNKKVDFKKSIENGIEIKYQNWDSDNRLLKIFYTNHNTKYPFQNKQVWAFKAVRQFRQDASKAFQKNWQKYIVISPEKKISTLLDRHRKTQYAKKQNLKPIVPEGYNEFNI